MDETRLLAVRTCPRLCPSLPYAKHTVGVAEPLPCAEGSSVPQHTNGVVSAASHAHEHSTVRILAILCSSTTPCSDVGEASAHDESDVMEGVTQPAPQPRTQSSYLAEPILDSSCSAPSSCSRKRPRTEEDADHTSTTTTESLGVAPRTASSTGAPQPAHTESSNRTRNSDAVPLSDVGTVYLRVMYDDTLLETLPLELFREKHPQILIDYLLSVGCWL